MVSVLLYAQKIKGQLSICQGARTMSNSLWFVVLYAIAIIFNNNERVAILDKKKKMNIQSFMPHKKDFTSKKQHYLANFMSPLDEKAYQVHFLSQF